MDGKIQRKPEKKHHNNATDGVLKASVSWCISTHKRGKPRYDHFLYNIRTCFALTLKTQSGVLVVNRWAQIVVSNCSCLGNVYLLSLKLFPFKWKLICDSNKNRERVTRSINWRRCWILIPVMSVEQTRLAVLVYFFKKHMQGAPGTFSCLFLFYKTY